MKNKKFIVEYEKYGISDKTICNTDAELIKCLRNVISNESAENEAYEWCKNATKGKSFINQQHKLAIKCIGEKEKGNILYSTTDQLLDGMTELDRKYGKSRISILDSIALPILAERTVTRDRNLKIPVIRLNNDSINLDANKEKIAEYMEQYNTAVVFEENRESKCKHIFMNNASNLFLELPKDYEKGKMIFQDISGALDYVSVKKDLAVLSTTALRNPTIRVSVNRTENIKNILRVYEMAIRIYCGNRS